MFKRDKTDTSIDDSYRKYSKLDVIMRKQNLNRTNGLLAGPLYSKIISEAFLTRIDKELIEAGLTFSRYVDDYEVCLFNDDEKIVISIFTKILKRYGMSLNNEKTKIIDFPYYVTKNLAKIFDEYTDGNSIIGKEELLELFNNFATIEAEGTKGALRYLLKSLEKRPIETENPLLYKAYLISILENNERSLTKVCSLLIKNKNKLLLNEYDVKRIKLMLKRHIECGHDLEVMWLLYLLIETDKLCDDVQLINQINEHSNELAKIILLQKNLLGGENISKLVETATSWILLYELYVNEHISESVFQERLHIDKNLEMYKYLKNHNIHFCTF